MRSDDLAPLLAGPGPDPTAIRGGKGTVIEWDPETGDNVIRFRGTDLVNLPIVAASAWVLQTQPGDEVLLNIFGTGGFATIYIVGPITQPGPEIRDIVRQALAAGTVVDSVTATEDTISTTFTDLSTPGPAVTATIGASGKCLVWISCSLNPVASDGSQMSVAVSGATTRAADDFDTVPYIAQWGPNDQVAILACNVTLLQDLNPGSNTITAKYRSSFGTNPSFFGNRTIVVMPF